MEQVSTDGLLKSTNLTETSSEASDFPLTARLPEGCQLWSELPSIATRGVRKGRPLNAVSSASLCSLLAVRRPRKGPHSRPTRSSSSPSGTVRHHLVRPSHRFTRYEAPTVRKRVEKTGSQRSCQDYRRPRRSTTFLERFTTPRGDQRRNQLSMVGFRLGSRDRS